MVNERKQINITGYHGQGGAKKRSAQEFGIPNSFELKEKIESTYQSLRDKALFCFIYLTGARISEVLGVYRKQITIEEKFGKAFIIVYNVTTLKRIRKTYKGQPKPPESLKHAPLRTISIRIDKEGYFTETFKQYLDLLKTEPEELLFPMKRQWAWVIIARSGYWCHFLRHVRLSHLVKEYRFNSYELKEFTGWKTLEMGENYVKLSGDFLAQRMSEA